MLKEILATAGLSSMGSIMLTRDVMKKPGTIDINDDLAEGARVIVRG
jgi:hypothetical protein